jgi:hypothetical protein
MVQAEWIILRFRSLLIFRRCLEYMPDNREFLKDLLLEDYRYRAEALKHSEQSGETRVNIFIGVVTLVAGAVVSISMADHGPDASALRLIIEVTLAVLVVIGILTLMRLLIRNKHTDQCKRDLGHIREVFKDLFDQDSLLGGVFSDRKKAGFCGQHPWFWRAGAFDGWIQ